MTIHPEHLFHHVCRRCQTYIRRCNYRIFNPGHSCLIEQQTASNTGSSGTDIEREIDNNKTSGRTLIQEQEQAAPDRQAIDDDREARETMDFTELF